MIFRRYVATGSSFQVARELNDSPQYARADGKLWRPTMVLVILKSHVYTGKLEMRRTGEPFDGRHDAMIDEAQYEAAQKALAFNRKDDGKSKRHSLYTPSRGFSSAEPAAA